jgi:hypothetical protein
MNLVVVLWLFIAQTPAACGTLAECRDQALAAADKGDYETFHDLAWRAVQKGKPNDPTLMLMLARAQSLSGRPGDALVMLQRLVDMGVPVDASSDDFRRVRALKGWPELEAKMAGRPAPPPPTPAEPATPPASPAAPAAAPPVTAVPERAPSGAAPATTDASEEALSFDAAPFDAVGLAYDGVSRRFIVGDRTAGRLIVIDETSHHVANLVSAASAGFLPTITAFEIDTRRGDLWVASASPDGHKTALHKLQLVSGRVLDQVTLDADGDPVTIGDVAILSDGTILALEQRGGRLLRLRPRARSFEESCRLGLSDARSLSVVDDRIAYVSSDAGIAHVDLANCASTAIRVHGDLDVKGIDRLRWQGGGLILLQRAAGGQTRISRARLDGAGKSITRSQLVTVAGQADPRTSTIAGTDLFYLAGGNGSPSIRKAKLK